MNFEIHFISLYILNELLLIYCEAHIADTIGRRPEPSNWPFLAFYTHYEEFYGATLITERCVVTSGTSCVYMDDKEEKWNVKDSENSYVLLGNFDRYTDCNSGSCRKFQVKDIKVHPRFNYWTRTNDVGILILKKAVGLDSRVNVMYHLAERSPEPKTLCLGIGFLLGMRFVKLTSIDLHEVSYQILTNEQCEKLYEEFRKRPFRHNLEHKTCVHQNFTGNIKGMCMAAGGYPLICDGKLTGIRLQYEYEACPLLNVPVIYMAIPVVRTWIIDTIHNSTPEGYKTFDENCIEGCRCNRSVGYPDIDPREMDNGKLKVKLSINVFLTIYLSFQIYKC